jgi:hypothetical protein
MLWAAFGVAAVNASAQSLTVLRTFGVLTKVTGFEPDGQLYIRA